MTSSGGGPRELREVRERNGPEGDHAEVPPMREEDPQIGKGDGQGRETPQSHRGGVLQHRTGAGLMVNIAKMRAMKSAGLTDRWVKRIQKAGNNLRKYGKPKYADRMGRRTGREAHV